MVAVATLAAVETFASVATLAAIAAALGCSCGCTLRIPWLRSQWEEENVIKKAAAKAAAETMADTELEIRIVIDNFMYIYI